MTYKVLNLEETVNSEVCEPFRIHYRSHFTREDDVQDDLNCKVEKFVYNKSELILHGSKSISRSKPNDWETITSKMPGICREPSERLFIHFEKVFNVYFLYR